MGISTATTFADFDDGDATRIASSTHRHGLHALSKDDRRLG
jgi:hypothetical protein